MKTPLIAGVVLLAAIGGAVIYGGQRYLGGGGLDNLAQRTRDGLIYVPGGSFVAGSYQADIVLPDGTRGMRWVSDSPFVLAPYPVTLDAFYLQDREATNTDFGLFLQNTGRPDLRVNIPRDIGVPDKAAVMAWHEASAYCTWLGDLAGLPLQLPSESQWEYAARSRGQTPPWATDDGVYREGLNIAASGTNPPVASYPPNPLGFYNMADGVAEWVSDAAPSDTHTAHIAKGGTNRSDKFYETIPTRSTYEGVDTLLPGDPDTERLMYDAPALIHIGYTGVRCAAAETAPPDQSGFGRAPDLDTAILPDVYELEPR